MKRKMLTGILTMLFVLLMGMSVVMADDFIIADTDEKAEEMGVDWFFIQPEAGNRVTHQDIINNTIDITLVKGEKPLYLSIGFGEYERHMNHQTVAVSGASAILYDGNYGSIFPSISVIPGDWEQAILRLMYNNQTEFEAGRYKVTIPAGYFQIREANEPHKLYTNQEVTINITIVAEAPSLASSPSVKIEDNYLTWDAIKGAACYDVIYYEDGKTIPNGSGTVTATDLNQKNYICDVSHNFPYLPGHKYSVIVTAYPIETSKAGGKQSTEIEIPFVSGESDFPAGVHMEWVRADNSSSVEGKTILKVTADESTDLKNIYFIMRLYADGKRIMNWRAIGLSNEKIIDATNYLERANVKDSYYMLVYAVDKNNKDQVTCSKPLQISEKVTTIEELLADITNNNLSAEQVNAIAEEILQKCDNINDLNNLLLNSANSKNDVRQGYTNLEQAARKAKNISVEESIVTDRLKAIFDETKLTSAGLALNVNPGTVSQKTDVALKIDEPKSTLPIPSGYNVSSSVQVDIRVEPALENPKYPVMITMPIPSTLNPNRRIVIFHGNEKIYPIVNTTAGTMTFSVTHFSTFAFANETATTTSPSDTTNHYRPSSSSSSNSSSNSTTIAAINTNVKPGNWAKNASGWWFSFTDKTYAKSQWLQIKDKWYFFDANGYMSTGWQMINGKWYYLDPTNGEMAEGWKAINGKWYFLNPANGDMATGWKMVESKWYYLDPVNGDMAEGWKAVNGKWYYLNPVSGDMATGKTLINNNWYYLTADGDCLMNAETPDGHRADANGVVLYGSAQ